MLPFQINYVLNLYSRPDRLEQFEQEAQKAELGPVKIMYAAPGDTPMKSFCRSQKGILGNFILTDATDCLILEDDVVFHDLTPVIEGYKELPEDWDILYLGANIVGTDLCSWPDPTPYSKHLCRVTQAWTTHAVAYSKKGAQYIHDRYDPEQGQMYDDFLRCNIEQLNTFIVNPMVADQRPGFSDLWNTHTHYGFFHPGNKRMKK